MANSSPQRTAARLAENNKTHGAKTNGQIKAYPAPKELATPTDLKPDEARSVVEALNPLIADAFALYTKTKNFHWHVASSHFRDYHLLLDEQAESILNSIDPLAERVRRIGGMTIRSISHIHQLQSIADDNHDYVPPDKMIQELIKDNRHMAERQRAAIEICDKNRDSASSNALQEILNQTEKRIWFLYEVSTGGKNEY
jgi:starvation-inducible DNA-binding protein